MGHLRRVYQHIFDAENNVNDSFVATLIAHTIVPGRVIDVFGMRFTPIRLLHGKLPIVGFRIEATKQVQRRKHNPQPITGSALLGSLPKPTADLSASSTDADQSPRSRPNPGQESDSSPFPLAYCTDVSAIPPESWSALHGVRTLVLDALRYRKHPTHMTIEEAVNVADRIGAAQTWFVHMSHDLPHAETDEALPAGMRLAYDGLVLE